MQARRVVARCYLGVRLAGSDANVQRVLVLLNRLVGDLAEGGNLPASGGAVGAGAAGRIPDGDPLPPARCGRVLVLAWQWH